VPDQLTFEDRGDYVLCTYSGAYGFPAVADAAHAAERRARLGTKRVLMDIRGSHGELSVAERYQVANEMGHRWERGVSLALLGCEDQRLPERPWEAAAVDRGPSTCTFTDESSALAWLLAQ